MSELQVSLTANQQFWQDKVKGWETSGLSQTAYCKREGISYQSFKGWRYRLMQKTHDIPKLVPAKVIPSVKPSKPTGLLVKLPNGIELNFRY